ncbi:dna primase small subunit [Cystoisospora suis]|uniref:Dna primase small subunit n=1 Tax=Cystoisospora suis TaxID=483139 RepID=A0A2C6KH15_9APIC|nr:dna primase small subunit [Cystoisospora suis]
MRACSRDIGHLLKSPFCIHHATGRVCVPLDISSSSPLPYKEGRIPQDEEEEEERKKKKKKKLFDPAGVPTLSVLRREFDDPSRAHLPPHLRTSLAPYLEFFRDKFLHKLLKSVAQEMKYVKKLVGNVDARVKPESCF